MKNLCFVVAMAAIGTAPASAQSDREFPAPTPFYPFSRSVPTERSVFIPPYHRPFTVRVYTTPAQQPFYNVPPYSVVSPY